jgi:hypothetical protein
MDFRIFELPTANDDNFVIERAWCELNTRLRNGDSLDEVEINWMDTANTWLMSTGDK